MKTFIKLALFAVLLGSSSCAMIFNKKEVEVTIKSVPSGADIFIEGINYGRTPATLSIIPKNYNVVLSKAGFGSASLTLESWATIRSGGKEGTSCLLDSLGMIFILPGYSAFMSGKCHDFKKKEYVVNIPYIGNGSNGGITQGRNSMRGVGQNPADMINYYYSDDMKIPSR